MAVMNDRGIVTGVMAGFPQYTEEQIRNAQRAVCDRFEGGEALELLQMLGLVK